MCLAAISSGWSVSESISLWSQTDLGHYSPSGRTFNPGPHTPQTPTRDWSNTEVRSLVRAPGEAPLSVYISFGRICAIASSGKIRIHRRHPHAARPPSLTEIPDFIALPRDALGRPIVPKSRVTALVEAQKAWHIELGQSDQTTSIIVSGLLVMPKIAPHRSA
jgi:hypothetical protein